MPKQRVMSQKIYKNTTESILWCPSIAGYRMYPEVSIYTMRLHSRKLFFPLQVLSTGDNSWFGMDNLVQFLLSVLWNHLTLTPTGPMRVATVYEYMEDTVSLESGIISGSYNLSTFCFAKLPKPEEKGLIKTFHLSLCLSTSHLIYLHLFIYLWVIFSSLYIRNINLLTGL